VGATKFDAVDAGGFPRNLPRDCDVGGGALDEDEDWDDVTGAERNFPRRGAVTGAFSEADMLSGFVFLSFFGARRGRGQRFGR
jgi:hypothetical protein